jgi:hypothetical protein
MRRRPLVIAGIALTLGAVSAGVAMGVGGDDDAPLTGRALERARAAALEHAGGGTVIETEAGDDGAAYGVEVRLPDGRRIEVHLDEGFAVVGQETDDDGAGDEDGRGDD